VKLIAEPWDATGEGYRVGGFGVAWSEWNGRFRDAARDFWRGHGGIGEVASRLTGSSDLYAASGRRPWASVNFVTAHDGFTLRDLVSYERKHNEANGEDNRDGTNDNRSWNCGAEGETEDPEVLALRRRQRRNFLATLLLSQGVPMLLGGDEIVRTHSARVYRLAYRLTGNPHDAADLTQDVFVRVFRSLSTYTPGTFEGWLHRITTNLFLDQVRRKQRIRFDALGEDAGERLASREPGPAQVYDDNHFDDDVQRALDALPPDFRAAVVLCDIEGLSYEEIAATLGIKLGTVRSRIHRGRAQLRSALEHRAPGRRPVEERPE